MRRVLFLVVVSAIAFGLPLFADSDQEVAEEVIAITQAQWAAEIAGTVGSRLEIAADEYTEFSPTAPVRIDGKALNRDFAEAFANGGGKMLAGDMVNPKVQVHGDVAILSYNFVGVSKSKDGEVTPILSKSTRVYAKMDGAWQLVHANFAPVGD